MHGETTPAALTGPAAHAVLVRRRHVDLKRTATALCRRPAPLAVR